MARLEDFVRRFRPAAAPGAAAPAGVPADRAAELAAELAPVFEALRIPRMEADDIIAAARREAVRRRERAAGRADELRAEARLRAAAAKEVAAAAAVAAADEDRVQRLDAARRDVAEITRRAAERTPMLVERVLDVMCMTGADPEPAR